MPDPLLDIEKNVEYMEAGRDARRSAPDMFVNRHDFRSSQSSTRVLCLRRHDR